MAKNDFLSGYDGGSRIKFDPNELKDLPDVMLSWIEYHSQTMILVFDQNGYLHYISHSIETILNKNPEKLIGKHWQKLFAQKNKSHLRRIFSTIPMAIQNIKVNLKNNLDELQWFNATVSSIYYNDKPFYLMSLLDISQEIKLEELIMQSENLSVMGQLAATIVHEIRNPLTALKGFLQLLAAGVDAKDAYYNIMIDEINKIETIASQLLFMAKPMTTNKQPESIRCMLKEVIALLRSEARMKNIEIIESNFTDTTVLCNRMQIKQALINIIKNAIEAVDAKGQIVIEMHKKNKDYVIIDVIDEGPGISEEIIHKLSEPFYTTKQKGTGLGLMITQKIIDEHDGILRVIKNKHKGSTFRLKFPIYQLTDNQ